MENGNRRPPFPDQLLSKCTKHFESTAQNVLCGIRTIRRQATQTQNQLGSALDAWRDQAGSKIMQGFKTIARPSTNLAFAVHPFSLSMNHFLLGHFWRSSFTTYCRHSILETPPKTTTHRLLRHRRLLSLRSYKGFCYFSIRGNVCNSALKDTFLER